MDHRSIEWIADLWKKIGFFHPLKCMSYVNELILSDLSKALENHDFLEFFLIWVCIMGSFLSNASRVDPKSRLHKSLFLIYFHRYYFTSISFLVWIWFWSQKKKKKTYISLGTPIWISLLLNGYIFQPTTFLGNFSIDAIQNIFSNMNFSKLWSDLTCINVTWIRSH